MSDTASINKPQNCPYCGMLHERTVCPLIKAIEYHTNGTTKRVEFHGPAPLINYPPPHYPAPGPQWPFDLPFPQIT